MAWNVKINTLPVHPQNTAFASVLGSTKLHLDLGTDTDMASDTYYGIPWNQAPGLRRTRRERERARKREKAK